MQRVFAPDAAHSHAAPPECTDADEHGLGDGSAAKPTPQFLATADAQRWLTTECVPEDTSRVQRLRESVHILRTPTHRQTYVWS